VSKILDELADYEFEGASEQQIREEWIAPLLSLLGYGRGTINRIVYEQRLDLAEPIRHLGTSRYEVDYRPTVLGAGLWIIEAKRPTAAEAWDREHLGQAWSYATHPEINVPLIALSDGQRLTVYNMMRSDWESPELELAHHELAQRFGEVETVLGARQVAGFVLRRQVEYLKRAFEAQVDPNVPAEIIREIEQAAKDARPKIAENQRTVLIDQEKKTERDWERIVEKTGVWAIAQSVNQPFALNLAESNRMVEVINAIKDPAGQLVELDSFLEACMPRGTGDAKPRVFWMARLIRLDAALKLVGPSDLGARASEIADGAIRDHLENFPDDPVARAAHRLELVLAPFVVRQLLAEGPIDYSGEAERLRQLVDPEVFLRSRFEAPDLFTRHVTLICRRLWAKVEPWEAGTLNMWADLFEALLPTIQFDRQKMLGPAADPFLEGWQLEDPLKKCTKIVVEGARGRMEEHEDEGSLLVAEIIERHHDHLNEL
jgi:hypothetical protein